LADELNWVKISGAAWKGNGFYYSRYPAPEKGASGLSAKNENHCVYYHKVGTMQSEDALVYENKENPQRFNTAATSEDEDFLFLYISDRGKGLAGNAIYFKNLKAANTNTFKPLVKEITNDNYRVIDHTADDFLLETTEGAPNGKVIAVGIESPNLAKSKLIIPEKPEPLKNAATQAAGYF
jgi:prolyl oligopeptidase